MHIHGAYLMIVVVIIIVYALVAIAATIVLRYLVRTVLQLTAAVGIFDRRQNMEELRHALLLGIAANGICFYKRRPSKSRFA